MIGYDLKFPVSKINSNLLRKYSLITYCMPGTMTKDRDTKIIGSVLLSRTSQSSTKEES